MISVLTLEPFEAPTPKSIAAGPSPTGSHDAEVIDAPTQLCRWSIHVRHQAYQPIPDEPGTIDNEVFDISDPSSWKEWNRVEMSDPALSMVEIMQNSLSQSAFSPTPPESLPISIQSISESLQRHPDQLRLDAFRAAIMAGNVDLMIQIFDDAESSGIESEEFTDQVAEIYPFHLAAAFLDGGNACCNVVDTLFSLLSFSLFTSHQDQGYRDSLDNTVLDAFMISILRSHTSVTPDHVNNNFNPPHRFPGEDKDICGRWDATSPVLRNHFQRGYVRIPSRWKHAFCHTAVQAICHSIIGIFGSPACLNIDQLSGLFIRRCTNCGLKLELGPLHALVVVAFYLAHQGMRDETLFGPLAILVCLLSLGADQNLVAAISIQDILGGAEPGECHHRPMNAAELMGAVPHPIISRWSRECQTGWHCIFHVLRLRETDARRKESTGAEDTSPAEPTGNSDGETDDDSGQEMYDVDDESCQLEDIAVRGTLHDEWLQWPRGTPILSTLWATIQVELLTYRRIEIGQPWVSDKFSMVALREWLEGRTYAFDTPLLTERLMKSYSGCCGWFLCGYFAAPIAEDVCTEHFMNMEVYNRATFLRQSEWNDRWADYI